MKMGTNTGCSTVCKMLVILGVAPGIIAAAVSPSVRVNDLGTGAKEALVIPALELRESIREFFQGGNTQMGVENEQGTLLYNLTDQPQAGMSALKVGTTVVYDQQPYFVVNTPTGVKWTNKGQGRIYGRNNTSSGYYRDFYFRPFRFDAYSNVIGEFQYHVFSDKMHEESRISSTNMGDVSDAWVEYPIQYSSYQLYEGASLTPVSKTEVQSGALLVKRPNGSLLGFVFPSSTRNSKVEVIIEGGQLKVRHHANMSVTELSSRPGSTMRKTVVTWGRRILLAASYDQEKTTILENARQELNPLASSAFSVSRVNQDGNQYSSWVDPVAYDELTGAYVFETEGMNWGDAVKVGGWPNKYAGARVTVNNPTDNRLIYMRHNTGGPSTAVVLQDGNGYPLPIPLAVTRSLGGNIADWTGAFANECPFTTETELQGYGRSEFPVRLQTGKSMTFIPLLITHKWGNMQVPATGSVISETPLFTSNVGVWCSVDLKPWEASTGDFRGFSSQATQWAWGVQTPENVEQWGGGLHFYYGDVGDRQKEFQKSRSLVPSLSHFRQENTYNVDGGKFAMTQTWSALPDKEENRVLGDLDIVVKQDVNLAAGERIKLVHFMSDYIFFYNAFFSSTAQNALSPQYIGVPNDYNVASSTVQTVNLNGSKPAFALTDKRWSFDPNTATPSDPTFANMQANMYVQVFQKSLTLQGQDGNSIPLALRIGKKKPAGGYYDNGGVYQEHKNYVTYELVLEKEGLTLKAGDHLRFSFMVMSYGGKIINNEITSAENTHTNYALPDVSATTGGTQEVASDYPWVPVVRSPNGSTAEFQVTGGESVMSFSVEGLYSWKPLKLYRMNGATRQEVTYKVNGNDGYRSYVDSNGLIGISIPVTMSDGAGVSFQVEQDNSGVPAPDLSSSSSSSAPPNHWDFTSTLENWSLANSLSGQASASVASLTLTGADPQMLSPLNLKYATADYPFVIVGMKNQTTDNTAELFWIRNTGLSYNTNKHATFAIQPNDAVQRDYVLNLSANTYWIDTLEQLRLDVAVSAATGSIGLDYVKLAGAYPLASVPHTFPDTIEVENFNRGGEGNAYHDLSVTNEGGAYRTGESVDIQSIPSGGFSVGWLASGEWLEYLVNVPSSMLAEISLTAASVNGNDTARLLLDGQPLGQTFAFGPTGGIHTYATKTITAQIPSGVHVLCVRIEQTGGGFNLDRIVVKNQDIPTKFPQDPGSRQSPSPKRNIYSLDGTLMGAFPMGSKMPQGVYIVRIPGSANSSQIFVNME
jgi:hypothetical protein